MHDIQHYNVAINTKYQLLSKSLYLKNCWWRGTSSSVLLSSLDKTLFKKNLFDCYQGQIKYNTHYVFLTKSKPDNKILNVIENSLIY